MRPFGSHSRSVMIYVIAAFALVGGFQSDAYCAADLEWLDSSEYASAQSVTVVVFLDHGDLTSQVQLMAAPQMSRDMRIKAVTQRLKSNRPAGIDLIEGFLKQHAKGNVQRFWIVPAFKVTLNPGDIKSLAILPGVAGVVPDLPVDLIAPVDTKTSQASVSSSSGHVGMLNVPSVWARGFTGKGRLVCSFDTGVEKDHPCLSSHWRGNHAPLSSAWFSTISPTSTPYDKADHGTHTMGIMVGLDGTDTIGVAPDAEWITAGVVDQGKSLAGTFADILGAFQWVLDPDGDPNTTDDVPDVILNSWGVPASMFSPCDQTFFAAIDNVEAAGIVCIFSAGNEGPASQSLRNPGSRASSPLNSFAVGAVDNAKVIASFSSRGPGGCGFTEIKPEIVAPGVSIRSAARDGGYKIMSGTSMAAPFIAGLVALCRQYNPNATVDEIKWAIIHSAEDLGPVGEDNAYGYGLPDASRMLGYLSDPAMPRFQLAGYSVSGNGIALPGETIDLRLTLTRITGTTESVDGVVIAPASSGVLVLNDSVNFFFGVFGTTSVGSGSYRLSFAPTLTHGDSVSLILRLVGDLGQIYDSLQLSLPVGYAPNGSLADYDTGLVKFTISDFGQYGLAAGSIYNLGRLGFRYDNSVNLLYEGGILIGRSALQLSSAVRDQNGSLTPSDFAPVVPLSNEWIGADGARCRTARYTDQYADVSIPVTITQNTAVYSGAGEEGIVILRYQLVNTSLTTLNDLYFGFLSDFDLPGGAENAVYDPSLDLLSQSGSSGPIVGVVGVSQIFSHQTIANAASKTGFTHTQLFNMISSSTSTDLSGPGDLMSIMSGGPYHLSPGDSVEVALALVAGGTIEEVRDRASKARDIYLSPTVVDQPTDALPNGYELYQNYPNPFNPTTMIAFNLPVSGEVSLRIYNLLGQQVRMLQSGRLAAGSHTIEWDGRTDNGAEVASGVYFYRLVADGFAGSRKMVLLR